MKTPKFLVALVAAGVGCFGFTSGAFAGEGGAAGSAAFTINNSQVTGVAVSAAIGKLDAVAGAMNNGPQNSAYAMGSGGVISINGITQGSVGSIASGTDPSIGSIQGNVFQGTININANGSGGTVANTQTQFYNFLR